MNNFQRFVCRWWYPLSIFPLLILFLTPGLTFIIFVSFIFLSGVAARPKIESLVQYAFAPANGFGEPPQMRSHTKRKALSKSRNEQSGNVY